MCLLLILVYAIFTLIPRLSRSAKQSNYISAPLILALTNPLTVVAVIFSNGYFPAIQIVYFPLLSMAHTALSFGRSR